MVGGNKGFKGHAARIKPLFQGLGKTRPIPRIVDASDRLAARVVQVQQTPRTSPVKAAFSSVSPNPTAGRKISGGGKANGGVYLPPGVSDNI